VRGDTGEDRRGEEGRPTMGGGVTRRRGRHLGGGWTVGGRQDWWARPRGLAEPEAVRHRGGSTRKGMEAVTRRTIGSIYILPEISFGKELSTIIRACFKKKDFDTQCPLMSGSKNIDICNLQEENMNVL
jgi:hypothetical protein